MCSVCYRELTVTYESVLDCYTAKLWFVSRHTNKYIFVLRQSLSLLKAMQKRMTQQPNLFLYNSYETLSHLSPLYLWENHTRARSSQYHGYVNRDQKRQKTWYGTINKKIQIYPEESFRTQFNCFHQNAKNEAMQSSIFLFDLLPFDSV